MKNIVSLSFGKDSTAMLLLMLQKKIKIDEIYFCDTTLEYPEIYEYKKQIQTFTNKEIITLTPKKSFDEWFYGTFISGKMKGRRRGFPYCCTPCWWNREAKYKLLDKAHGKGNIVFIGIAKDEEKRIYAKQYQKDYLDYRFPLVEWNVTEQDCFAYLQKIGLPHPLAHMKRTGCWLCPKQNLSSLKILYLNYPDLWQKLKQYEKDSPHGFKPNFRLKDFEKKLKIERREVIHL